VVLGPYLVTGAQTQVNQQLPHVLNNLLESQIAQTKEVFQNHHVDYLALVVQLSAKLGLVQS